VVKERIEGGPRAHGVGIHGRRPVSGDREL